MDKINNDWLDSFCKRRYGKEYNELKESSKTQIVRDLILEIEKRDNKETKLIEKLSNSMRKHESAERRVKELSIGEDATNEQQVDLLIDRLKR